MHQGIFLVSTVLTSSSRRFETRLKRNYLKIAFKGEECWTQSIATGSRTFVQTIKSQMAGFAFGRKLRKSAEGFELREPSPGYNAFLEFEKSDIEAKNLWYWDG